MKTPRVLEETTISFGDVSPLYPRLQISKRRVRNWTRKGRIGPDGRRFTLDWWPLPHCVTSVEAVRRFFMATGDEPGE